MEDCYCGVCCELRRGRTPATKSVDIIGLIGYAQSGKDTVAEMLDGYQRLAFADAMRELALAANPKFSFGSGLWTLQQLVDQFGWDYAKGQVPGVREFLQNLGVGVREVIGENSWVRIVTDQIEPGGRYVITDVRFPNEAEAILKAGGVLIRVIRPGTGPVNGHSSESLLDGYPVAVTITNDGTLDDLRAQVAKLA
jgi:hypothetical protein